MLYIRHILGMLVLLHSLGLGAFEFNSVPDMTLSLVNDPDWPVELIPIQNESYTRNSRASFCTRPIEMIDTVVIHHSETPTTSTPIEINDFHLNRGTADDPWYMIAYSYVINAPYKSETLPIPLVTEGRPLEIVGAHAGSEAFVEMDEEQKKIWDEGKILCGKENGDFKPNPNLLRNGMIKANVTTIGVVVVGNYAPFSGTNLGGYSKKNPRYPTVETQDMIARLSCQLQKKYPKIRNIKWHNFYNSTTCPGSIKKYVGQIKARAKGYGCDFN